MAALLRYLNDMLDNGVVSNFETAAKVLLYLMTPQPGQRTTKAFLSITAEGENSLQLIDSLRARTVQGLTATADTMDFNIAGLRFVMNRVEESKKVKFFDVSKIQGHKKKYHSAAISNPTGPAPH
jgi:U3 small nucleolar RNA-associated protein 12